MIIYKAIPGPKVISISDGNHATATNSFAAIINAEAQAGWTYHSMETVTVQEKVGCSLQPQFVHQALWLLLW